VTYDNTPEAERELFRDLIAPMTDPVGIEIGVLNGETSAFLLSLGVTLTGIDPILPDSMESSLVGDPERIKANTAPYGDRFTFIKRRSQRCAWRFLHESVDFVFVDGSHHYVDVKRDVRMYLPKIKKGGVLFLHDCRMNRGGPPFHKGPSKLADELVETLPVIGEAFSLIAFRKP
jgi:hypothetical protein